MFPFTWPQAIQPPAQGFGAHPMGADSLSNAQTRGVPVLTRLSERRLRCYRSVHLPPRGDCACECPARRALRERARALSLCSVHRSLMCLSHGESNIRSFRVIMKAACARSLWLGASYLGDIGEDFWIRVRPDGKLKQTFPRDAERAVLSARRSDAPLADLRGRARRLGPVPLVERDARAVERDAPAAVHHEQPGVRRRRRPALGPPRGRVVQPRRHRAARPLPARARAPAFARVLG